MSWMKLGGEGYFLSRENPAATTEQREVEDLALRLMARPELQRARKTRASVHAAGSP